LILFMATLTTDRYHRLQVVKELIEVIKDLRRIGSDFDKIHVVKDNGQTEVNWHIDIKVVKSKLEKERRL
jgi:TFIIF-interacting CTD phosphatase-like protein